MTTDRLGDMRLFAEAAESGSLSAAGRRLGLSPAAASARLLKLEKALASRLFERTTRQLRLTDEGRLYLEHCRIALQAIDDGEAALHASKQQVRGKVRLTATSDFGRNLLNRWLAQFAERYPEVTIALTLSDGMSNLLQDDIDLAIRFSPPQDSSLAARHLARDERLLCASPAYLERFGAPATPQDLAQHRFVVWVGASGAQNVLEFSRGEERRQYTVPLEQAWESNDGAMVRDWALAGRGIAYKSIWDLEGYLRENRLRIVLPDWQLRCTSVHALFHRNRYMAPRVRALLDFLAERFAEAEQARKRA